MFESCSRSELFVRAVIMMHRGVGSTASASSVVLRCQTRNRQLVNATILRFQSFVRGSLNYHERDTVEDVHSTLREKVETLLTFLNGDWRIQQLQTWNPVGTVGCEGRCDREAVCECVYSAIVDAGLVGGVVTTIPAKSRWGTCAQLSVRACRFA